MPKYTGSVSRWLSLFILLNLYPVVHSLKAQTSATSPHIPEIKQTFGEYIEHLQAARFEKMISYLYEPVFESMISKEAMLNTLQERANETPQRLFTDSSRVISVSDIIQKKNTDYALMRYQAYIRASTKLAQEDSTESQEEYSDFMVSMFEALYGEEHVQYDTQSLMASIQAVNKLICVREAGSQDWKFVEWKPGFEKILKKFIPSSVLKAWEE